MRIKQFISVGLIMILLLSLGACDLFQGLFQEESVEYGSLSVTVGDSRSTTILPEYDLDIERYRIEGTHKDGHSFTKDDLSGSELVISNIPVGYWEIIITGKNQSDNAISQGKATVLVESGGVTRISMHLERVESLLDGQGKVLYHLSWDSGVFDSPTVIWSITAEGEAETSRSCTPAGDVISFIEELDAGAYQLRAQVYDEDYYWFGSPSGVVVLKGISSRAEDAIPSEMVFRRTACDLPVVNRNSGSFNGPVSITIEPSLASDDATEIRYTTDGTIPTESHGTFYTEPLEINYTTTLKAIAYSPADFTKKRSSVITKEYTINDTVSPVTFSLASGIYSSSQVLELSTMTSGCTIRYTTDGTDPTATNGETYTEAITIDSADLIEIRAIAAKDDAYSEIQAETYRVTGTLDAVTSSIDSGIFNTRQFVEFNHTDDAVSMRYTIDGSLPTLDHGTEYLSSIEVSESTRLTAVAFKEGWLPSEPLTIELDMKTGDVTFSKESGTYCTEMDLTLETQTDAADIYYTIDGTVPDKDSGAYYAPGTVIRVKNDLVIKAVAYCSGWMSSDITSKTYDFKVDTLGLSEVDEELIIDCDTSKVVYYYTTNGTDPIPGINGKINYSGKVPLDIAEYDIRVIATRTGWQNSDQSTLIRDFLSPGDTGPAGGFIIYDDRVGFDTSGNGTIEADERDLLDGTNDGIFEGDRYIEAAPAAWGSEGSIDPGCEWGTYRRGHIFPLDTNSEQRLISTGEANTEAITRFHDDLIIIQDDGSIITYYTNPESFVRAPCYNDGSVASKVCQDAVINGYDDWFLPSKDELYVMYSELYLNDLGGFLTDYSIGYGNEYGYWSSSEVSDNHACCLRFGKNVSGVSLVGELHVDYPKKDVSHIRPARRF